MRTGGEGRHTSRGVVKECRYSVGREGGWSVIDECGRNKVGERESLRRERGMERRRNDKGGTEEKEEERRGVSDGGKER